MIKFRSIFLGTLALITVHSHGMSPVPAVLHYTPATVTIGFDIDDVILKKPMTPMELINNHKKLLAKTLFKVPLLYKALRLWKNNGTGYDFKKLFEDEQQPELAAMVDEIRLTKTPIENTAKVIQRLAKAGYSLCIATNMGIEDFVFYQKKYPEVFSHFSFALVVNSQANPTASNENTYKIAVKKTKPEYFKALISQNEQRNPGKKIVFIDDKKNNVTAAQKEGIISIHFESGEQLEKELESLGILA